MPFNICCGSCFFCARELYSNCHNTNANASAVGGIYGYSHTAGGYDGAQAEYVRVPFADVGPSKIPDWMEEEDAVLLTDACPTGYFGAELGEIKEGDVVVVYAALDRSGSLQPGPRAHGRRAVSSSSTISNTVWKWLGRSRRPRPSTSQRSTIS